MQILRARTLQVQISAWLPGIADIGERAALVIDTGVAEENAILSVCQAP
jgi:hypothetical protein